MSRVHIAFLGYGRCHASDDRHRQLPARVPRGGDRTVSEANPRKLYQDAHDNRDGMTYEQT